MKQQNKVYTEKDVDKYFAEKRRKAWKVIKKILVAIFCVAIILLMILALIGEIFS